MEGNPSERKRSWEHPGSSGGAEPSQRHEIPICCPGSDPQRSSRPAPGKKPKNPTSTREPAKEPKPLRAPRAPALREEPPALTQSGSAGSGRGSLSRARPPLTALPEPRRCQGGGKRGGNGSAVTRPHGSAAILGEGSRHFRRGADKGALSWVSQLCCFLPVCA